MDVKPTTSSGVSGGGGGGVDEHMMRRLQRENAKLRDQLRDFDRMLKEKMPAIKSATNGGVAFPGTASGVGSGIPFPNAPPHGPPPRASSSGRAVPRVTSKGEHAIVQVEALQKKVAMYIKENARLTKLIANTLAPERVADLENQIVLKDKQISALNAQVKQHRDDLRKLDKQHAQPIPAFLQSGAALGAGGVPLTPNSAALAESKHSDEVRSLRSKIAELNLKRNEDEKQLRSVQDKLVAAQVLIRQLKAGGTTGSDNTSPSAKKATAATSDSKEAAKDAAKDAAKAAAAEAAAATATLRAQAEVKRVRTELKSKDKVIENQKQQIEV
jgi:hypothetical protein